MRNAAVWLREVEQRLGDPLEINWRSFPLEQVNRQDDTFVFWEQTPQEAKSLNAFLAAEAAFLVGALAELVRKRWARRRAPGLFARHPRLIE